MSKLTDIIIFSFITLVRISGLYFVRNVGYIVIGHTSKFKRKWLMLTAALCVYILQALDALLVKVDWPVQLTSAAPALAFHRAFQRLPPITVTR